MAANAYVFLKVEPAKTSDVVARLSALPRVTVREVLGPYDIVVEIERDTLVDITGLVRSKIRAIPGVTNSTTCMWMDGSAAEGGGE